MHYFKHSVPSHAIFVCLRFPTADAHSQTHTVEPVNTWKRLDDTTTTLYLNCTIEYGQFPDSTDWISHLTDPIDVVSISSNHTVYQGFVNDFVIEETFNLVFKRPSLNKSGSYTCRNSIEPFLLKKAEVIILGEFYALDKLVATCTFCLLLRLFMC